jgi:hypothetical protein
MREDNIKMDLKIIEFRDVYWVKVVQGRVRWRDF